MNKTKRFWKSALSAVVLASLGVSATAGTKLTATGGVSPIEGGAGGGISPWALISGYGSTNEWGGSAFYTQVQVDDFKLDAKGVAAGFSDRVELSAAKQKLEIEPLDLDLKQDVYGVKVRVFGELLYTAAPQLSVGVQYKKSDTFTVPQALGADDDADFDIYLAGSKVWFAALAGRNVLTNMTLRYTSAIETGLVGHADERKLVAEGSVVVFLSDNWVAGVEYRQKPDFLSSIEEHDWYHGFVGYFPNRHVSVTAAWANLDEIAGLDGQQGWYLSLQGHF